MGFLTKKKIDEFIKDEENYYCKEVLSFTLMMQILQKWTMPEIDSFFLFDYR